MRPIRDADRTAPQESCAQRIPSSTPEQKQMRLSPSQRTFNREKRRFSQFVVNILLFLAGEVNSVF
jgi:hypothetical protein